MAHIEARDHTHLPDAKRGGAGRPRRQLWHREFGIPLHRRAERLRQVDAFEYHGGFSTPSAGEIRIGGTPVTGYGMDRGVVFQDFAQLFPWRTALGNVAFGLEMKGISKTEREAIALEQLRLVKLENFARAYPHHLSGGMQQRVAIARALAYNPAVLLMDEPFAALDALTRDEMQRLLAEVWRTTRKTVIYVTHNVAEAVYLADRVLVMTPHPGTLKTEVPIRLSRPRDPLSVEFLDYQKNAIAPVGSGART
jgi:NitT/TauT family transport system ATP-binding protein